MREIDEFLAVLVNRLDPDAVPSSEAYELWSAFDAIERRAGAAKTLLARRVEDACAWKRNGLRSAAEQLALGAGTSVSAAKNMLETSKQVKKLPKTARALRKGPVIGGESTGDRGCRGDQARSRRCPPRPRRGHALLGSAEAVPRSTSG